MAARCDVCGGRAMPYRTYVFWMKPTAQCTECGANVRLRGFWTMGGAGVAFLGVSLAAIVAFPSVAVGIGVAALLSLSLILLDYGSYHVLVWEADHKLAVPDDELLELTTGRETANQGARDVSLPRDR